MSVPRSKSLNYNYNKDFKKINIKSSKNFPIKIKLLTRRGEESIKILYQA